MSICSVSSTVMGASLRKLKAPSGPKVFERLSGSGARKEVNTWRRQDLEWMLKRAPRRD